MINNRNGFGNDHHTEILVDNQGGTNGTTTFTDSSFRAATVGNQDNLVTHSNTQQKFYQTSTQVGARPLYFDIGLWTTQSITIGKSDMCIDFWINIDNENGKPFTDALYVGFFKLSGTKPLTVDYNNYCAVRVAPTYGNLYFEYNSGGTSAFQIGGSNFSYNINTWYHISAIRIRETELYLFVDGALVSSGTINSSYSNIKNLDYHLLHSHRTTTSTIRNFYIDEWRHSIGHGRWKSPFIVPNRPY